MKKRLLFALMACAAMPFLASCDDDDDEPLRTVSFESVSLDETGYLSAQDFVFFDELTFKCDTSYGAAYPMGFYVSSLTDMETEGYTNMYSVYNTAGHGGSKNFAIFNLLSNNDNDAIKAKGNGKTFSPKNVYVNLTTYNYLSTQNGDGYAKKFESGDWFTVSILGYRNGDLTDSVDINAIDYRDGNTTAMTDWTFVDLTPLKEVDAIRIHMNSSDASSYGINTPAYIAFDDFTYAF